MQRALPTATARCAPPPATRVRRCACAASFHAGPRSATAPRRGAVLRSDASSEAAAHADAQGQAAPNASASVRAEEEEAAVETGEQPVLLVEGVPGMQKVVLRHTNGSIADVFLRGATVTSWRISNGSDVLYVRPDTALEELEGKPISGGIPIIWPQFGKGGALGGVEGPAEVQQQHGFARNLDWEVVDQGLTRNKEPFVRLRLRDSPYSRALWDHAFELEYEVRLGGRQLGLSLTARNTGTGDAGFTFTAALHSYLGVVDVREEAVMLLGLQGAACVDKLAEAPAVQQETRPALRITGPTDKVFLNAQQRVALEVGTGATVFVENSQGFTDFVVWNPWTANEFYGNFVCVENALISQPVTLAPAAEWTGTSTLFVRDGLLSSAMVPASEEQEAGEAERAS